MIAFSRDHRLFSLTAEQTLAHPISEVFAFFADTGNLDVITPPWLRFEILTPRPVEMKVGALIDYRLRLRGIPIRWQSKITAWQPPHRFVDEQRRGPYRVWIHEHTFAERDSGTVVGDHVRYAVLGGWLADRLFVRRDLEEIFDYRQAKLREMFT